MASVDMTQGVQFWLVQKYKLARESFQVVGVFTKREDADAMQAAVDHPREVAIVDGVRDFDQLVDVLICDRLWPMSGALMAQVRAMRQAVLPTS